MFDGCKEILIRQQTAKKEAVSDVRMLCKNAVLEELTHGGKCLKQHCRIAHNDIELVFAVDPCIVRHLYCS